MGHEKDVNIEPLTDQLKELPHVVDVGGVKGR